MFRIAWSLFFSGILLDLLVVLTAAKLGRLNLLTPLTDEKVKKDLDAALNPAVRWSLKFTVRFGAALSVFGIFYPFLVYLFR